MTEVLEQLARDGSAQSRYELLVQLSDMVDGQKDTIVDTTAETFNAIAERILEQLTPEGRASFSAKVATYEWLPAELVALLANSDFNVAKPILEKSRLLSDNEMLSIIRKRGMAHRQAIARRPQLNDKVIDQLVELGEEKVIIDLVKNERLKIASLSYRNIIESSRGMRQLQEELINCERIPTEEYDILGKMLDASLRLRYVAKKNSRSKR